MTNVLRLYELAISLPFLGSYWGGLGAYNSFCGLSLVGFILKGPQYLSWVVFFNMAGLDISMPVF